MSPLNKFIKRFSMLGMFSLSAVFAYASFIFNKSDESGNTFSIFGPDVAEGSSCGVAISCANGSGSGTATASGSGTGTSSGTATASASGTSSGTGTSTGEGCG